jgi:hydrogenase nickel incorporation protein HypB
MCRTCGCSDDDSPGGHVHDDHAHEHPPDHGHRHPDADGMPAGGRLLRLDRDLREKNDRLAADNRRWFAERDVLVLNLLASPGAGKTTLLERTILDLGAELSFHVIEGDQATRADAERIEAAGAPAVQINTGTGCHLDAAMVARVLSALAPRAGGVVVIENVGNLVCPALFDLGEHAKVVVAAVTEGDDKPLKYPYMFRAADVCLLNKVDLLPFVPFDVEAWSRALHVVHPRLPALPVSATRGDGLDAWYGWLRARAGARREPARR